MSTVQCKKCEDLDGPGNYELQANPATLIFSCANGHQYTDMEIADMLEAPKSPKKAVKGKVQLSDGDSGKTEKNDPETASKIEEKLGKNGGLEGNPEPEKQQKNPNALDVFIESVDRLAGGDFAAVELLPDGDQMIPVRVPEGYIEAVRQEAENEGKTESEWLSERMRESLEGFFVSYQTVATRGQFPSPIGG